MNRFNLLQLTTVASPLSRHSLENKQVKNPAKEFLALLTLWVALSQAMPLSGYSPHYHRE